MLLLSPVGAPLPLAHVAARRPARLDGLRIGLLDNTKSPVDKIMDYLAARLRERIPGDCSVEFHPHGGSPAIQLSYDSPFLAKAKDALSDEWEKQALTIGSGGSIPVVGDFQTYLGMESLLVGFGLDDDRIHSPNEKYELTSFHKGQRSWARILDALTR